MSHRRTAIMTVTRIVPGWHEDTDEEIEVEVSGQICPAEPDVGIMRPYAEDIGAERLDNGKEIELTYAEQQHASELLADQDDDDGY